MSLLGSTSLYMPYIHQRQHISGLCEMTVNTYKFPVLLKAAKQTREKKAFYKHQTSKVWQPHVESQHGVAVSDTVVRHCAKRLTATQLTFDWLLLSKTQIYISMWLSSISSSLTLFVLFLSFKYFRIWVNFILYDSVLFCTIGGNTEANELYAFLTTSLLSWQLSCSTSVVSLISLFLIRRVLDRDRWPELCAAPIPGGIILQVTERVNRAQRSIHISCCSSAEHGLVDITEPWGLPSGVCGCVGLCHYYFPSREWKVKLN